MIIKNKTDWLAISIIKVICNKFTR